MKVSDVQYHLATKSKVEEKTANKCIQWLMKNYNRAKDPRLRATMEILAQELGHHFKWKFIARCVSDPKRDGINVFGKNGIGRIHGEFGNLAKCFNPLLLSEPVPKEKFQTPDEMDIELD